MRSGLLLLVKDHITGNDEPPYNKILELGGFESRIVFNENVWYRSRGKRVALLLLCMHKCLGGKDVKEGLALLSSTNGVLLGIREGSVGFIT